MHRPRAMADAKRPAGGFTLIELMVTIAIAAILTVIAVPSFTQYQRNSELTRSANAFLASAMAVRAEAMKRQLNGMMRPQGSDNWSQGWLAYVDGDWDGAPGGATDVSVVTQDPLPSGVTVTVAPLNFASDGTSHYVLFNGAGFGQNLTGGINSTIVTFSNVAGSRIVKISSAGRMRVCNPVSDTTCTTANTF